MKISLLKIGRVAYPEYKSISQLFWSRLHPQKSFELIEFKDNDQAIKHLQSKGTPDSAIWVLDEKGVEFDSIEFSRAIRDLRDKATVKHLYIIVGHPLGLTQNLRGLSSKSICLSRLTFTSDLAFVVICEQLYRAFEILKGSAYHHG